jgi:hypothetical protein
MKDTPEDKDTLEDKATKLERKIEENRLKKERIKNDK